MTSYDDAKKEKNKRKPERNMKPESENANKGAASGSTNQGKNCDVSSLRLDPSPVKTLWMLDVRRGNEDTSQSPVRGIDQLLSHFNIREPFICAEHGITASGLGKARCCRIGQSREIPAVLCP